MHAQRFKNLLGKNWDNEHANKGEFSTERAELQDSLPMMLSFTAENCPLSFPDITGLFVTKSVNFRIW